MILRGQVRERPVKNCALSPAPPPPHSGACGCAATSPYPLTCAHKQRAHGNTLAALTPLARHSSSLHDTTSVLVPPDATATTAAVTAATATRVRPHKKQMRSTGCRRRMSHATANENMSEEQRLAAPCKLQRRNPPSMAQPILPCRTTPPCRSSIKSKRYHRHYHQQQQQHKQSSATAACACDWPVHD